MADVDGGEVSDGSETRRLRTAPEAVDAVVKCRGLRLSRRGRGRVVAEPPRE